ncbi:hypothetical protein Q757_04530 [Oenococcus alcoholitolerans]|uniref:phosphoglucomutase (alpha-D-glucose-1,6-bisphosphate-dependent) n=1 Tax=Oenococcus alcoholitolerans TaxID=931074 RepID=A0ABR4XQX7_9LACO|nr:hypothetical protein Q757_04530 [Oenococcus alcoholitolerans]
MSKFILIKTIVTSDFGKVIAQAHGVKALETLTGFKFIGEQVKKIDSLGSHIKLLIGYEESFGFLISPFVRDKDSIQAVVLASEISLINKINNQNLYTVLESLEKKYGYFYDKLLSYDFNTDNDKIKILNRVNILRKKVPDQILGLNIAAYEDYQVGERVNKCNQNKVPLSLPKSNVLKIFFSGGSWLAIRPSGTEPKIKTYISVRGKTDFEAKNLLKKLVCYVNNFLYK